MSFRGKTIFCIPSCPLAKYGNMKKLLMTPWLLLWSCTMSAQIGLGGNLNYHRYSDFGPALGLGLQGSYVVRETVPVRVSALYSFPQTEDSWTSATALSSTTSPESRLVSVKTSSSKFTLAVDGQRFFGNGDISGGFYGYLGVGLMICPEKETFGSVPEGYDVGQPENGTIVGLVMRGGLGYERGFGFANLYLEVGLNLPPNNVNGQTVDQIAPAALLGVS